jgi:hypothetical protein
VVIILEGMDGTGKSNLLGTLSKDLMIPVHKRASSSTGGPVKNLWEWAYDDVMTMYRQRFQIYDRHPLVSEYIYGPIIRQDMDERFYSMEGSRLCTLFRESVLVIYCDPGILEVEKNISTTQHMPGVTENWKQLYYSYRSMFIHWSGNMLPWDYRNMGTYSYLRSLCVNFMAERKTEFQR